MRGALLRLFDERRSLCLQSAEGRRTVSEMKRCITEEAQTQTARVLFDDGIWRVALQALGNDASLPIHDHPGSRGLICVVQGVLVVRRFDAVESPGWKRTAYLIERGKRTLGIDECDWVGRRRNNLHSLQSKAPFTLVFGIRQCVQRNPDRRAYAFIHEPGSSEPGGLALAKPVTSSGPSSEWFGK